MRTGTATKLRPSTAGEMFLSRKASLISTVASIPRSCTFHEEPRTVCRSRHWPRSSFHGSCGPAPQRSRLHELYAIEQVHVSRDRSPSKLASHAVRRSQLQVDASRSWGDQLLQAALSFTKPLRIAAGDTAPTSSGVSSTTALSRNYRPHASTTEHPFAKPRRPAYTPPNDPVNRRTAFFS